MAVQEIQGANIQLLLRRKNTGDFLEMVCEETVFLDVSNDVSKSSTKCGVFKGIQVADFKLNGSAVFNATPTASEMSYDAALGHQIDINKMEFILRNRAFDSFSAGDLIRMSGDCYFIQTQFDGSNGQVSKFTWTLEGSGTLNDTES
jgi:hypothetical protein